MMPRVRHVIDEESITITDQGLDLLLNMAQGDMRRSLNILQASHMAYNRIDDETVYKVSFFFYEICIARALFMSRFR